MTTKLVWLVRDLHARPTRPVDPLEAVSIGDLPGAAPPAAPRSPSTPSLPWVYHEVYAWAIPLVVGSMYWMLRVLLRPDRPRRSAGSAVFALAHDPHPDHRRLGGLPGALGIGLWLLPRPRLRPRPPAYGLVGARRRRWRRWPSASPTTGEVPATPTCSRSRTRCGPSSTSTGGRRSRPTAAPSPARSSSPPRSSTYFRPDGIRFVDYFPWVTLPAEPARGVRRRLHRPELPHRQRHRVHAVAAAADGLAALPVLFRARGRRRPGSGRCARRWSRACW